MNKPFFFLLRKTRKEESGYCLFTGQYVRDNQECEYWVAWVENPHRNESWVVASRETLPDLMLYLKVNYGEFRYIKIDIDRIIKGDNG